MSSWYTQTTRDNSVGLCDRSGRDYIVAHKNSTGSSQSTTSVIFSLAKIGSPNGVLTARIYTSAMVLEATSTNSVTEDDLTTSFVDTTFTFPALTTCPDGSFVCIYTTGTATGDNFTLVGTYVVTGDTYYVRNGTTTFVNFGDRLLTTTISGSAAPSSSGTRLPPPPIVLGGL